MILQILKGEKYTLAADVYSFALVMFEIGSRKRPYLSQAGDRALPMLIINGKRPDVPKDFPSFWAKLMVECWDADYKKRPSFNEIADRVIAAQEDDNSGGGSGDGSQSGSLTDADRRAFKDSVVKRSIFKPGANGVAGAASRGGKPKSNSPDAKKSSTCSII